MATVKSPKVFISYSWTPEENAKKVIKIAEELENHGISIVLDKRELRLGNDLYAYMERIVLDESISKVFIFCNKDYTDKANARKGGVGAEGSIISSNVYNQVNQNKFIPIIMEKDENNKPYMPVYLSSTLYLDFTDDSNYKKNFEILVRDITDQPSLIKHELGVVSNLIHKKDNQDLEKIHLLESQLHQKAKIMPQKEFEVFFGSVYFTDIQEISYYINTQNDIQGLLIHNIKLTKNDIELIRSIKTLTHLSLCYADISDLSFLSSMTQLTSLNLTGNQISDFSFLSSMTQLTSLNLSGNQISDISVLSSLTKLTDLDLTSNQISDISVLSSMTQLTSLNLSGNQISDFSFLSSMTQLTSLNLSGNQISDLSFLSSMTQLTSLNLSVNQIIDLSALSSLAQLTELDISNNQISDLSGLRNLTQLTRLYLFNNQISDLSGLSNLTQLTSLYLFNNQISNLSGLSSLTQLTSLYLFNNQISNLSGLSSLTQLTSLYLSKNQIIDITDIINLDLDFLNISDNPIENIPTDILNSDFQVIKDYWTSLQKGGDKLLEMKVVLVGDGGVGKTSIRKRLKDINADLPNELDSTRAIDIDEIPVEIQIDKNVLEFNLHLWDFGGQLIYHATHRFFLSEKALYLLVADSRESKCDFGYWCYFIQRFGKNSPIIIVINEKLDRPYLGFDYNKLKKTYNNIEDEEAINIYDTRGIDVLNEKIKEQIKGLYDKSIPFPKLWIPVRKEIEELDRNTIPVYEYLAICKKHNIEASEGISLLNVLNILGVCIYFEDNYLLNKTVYLKPAWLIQTVYKILDNKKIIGNHGEFDKKLVKEIWNNEEFILMHDELLELLKNFLIIYEKKDTDKYIIPLYLRQRPPEYEELINYREIIYDYEYLMPKGILHKLVVSMHELIDKDLVWYNGVILCYNSGNTRAEIIEDDSVKRIIIRVEGPFIRELVSLIISNLDKINSFYNDPPVKKLVPCICRKCKDIDTPKYYDYDELMSYKEDGIPEIECRNLKNKVPIVSLIDFYPIEKGYDNNTKLRNKDKTEIKDHKLNIVKVFLASSIELKKERKKINDSLYELSKKTVPDNNIFFDLKIWEEAIETIAMKGKQPDYNKLVEESDVFVCLYYTKVGKFTLEEFNLAYDNMKRAKKPYHMLVYKKDGQISSLSIDPKKVKSIKDFENILKKIKHPIITYKNTDNLLRKIEKNLRMLYLKEN